MASGGQDHGYFKLRNKTRNQVQTLHLKEEVFTRAQTEAIVSAPAHVIRAMCRPVCGCTVQRSADTQSPRASPGVTTRRHGQQEEVPAPQTGLR